MTFQGQEGFPRKGTTEQGLDDRAEVHWVDEAGDSPARGVDSMPSHEGAGQHGTFREPQLTDCHRREK